MIMMIGTGHVYNISEQVSFIIKHTWPDAVLIELDERRYYAVMNDTGEKTKVKSASKMYAAQVKYQNKMSEKNKVGPGGEMLTAILEGRSAGAEIICIDTDAEQNMKEIEESMPLSEMARFAASSVFDRMFAHRESRHSQKNFAENEEEYVRKMRKRYPTMVRMLIDERDEHMARKIIEASEKYKNMVVVVGDAHVRGICERLGSLKVEKIRLADMMDEERMNTIRSRIWEGRAEAKE